MGGIGEMIGGMVGGIVKGAMDGMSQPSQSSGNGQDQQQNLTDMLAKAGDINPAKIAG